MADLNNLLDEIEESHNDGTNDPALDPQPQAQQINVGGLISTPVRNDATSLPAATVPPALEAALAERNTLSRLNRADSADGEVDSGDDDEEVNISSSYNTIDEGIDGDYELLRSLWIQELICPELLPYNNETISLHKEKIEESEEIIDEWREISYNSVNGRTLDNDGSETDVFERTNDQNTDPMVASLAASIYKMEADRVKFVLADSARTRLAKIENYALHNRELLDRMSDPEIEHLRRYGPCIEQHLHRTVLSHLPKDTWKALDEPEMIPRPDLESYVFCQCLEDVEIDDGHGDDGGDEFDNNGGGFQLHKAGSSLIVRYSAISELVLEGKVVLLM